MDSEGNLRVVPFKAFVSYGYLFLFFLSLHVFALWICRSICSHGPFLRAVSHLRKRALTLNELINLRMLWKNERLKQADEDLASARRRRESNAANKAKERAIAKEDKNVGGVDNALEEEEDEDYILPEVMPDFDASISTAKDARLKW